MAPSSPSEARVCPGVVADANPWYALYLFHHQIRGMDLYESEVDVRVQDGILIAYLAICKPAGVVASNSDTVSVTVTTSGSSVKRSGTT
jgi:hypothetical protein